MPSTSFGCVNTLEIFATAANLFFTNEVSNNFLNKIFNTNLLIPSFSDKVAFEFCRSLNNIIYVDSSLHNNLWLYLHKNIPLLNSLELKNYSIDSYCLSDYSLKSKYLVPENILEYLNKDINNFKTIKGKGARLLEVSDSLILPTNSAVRVLVTSLDVIHSWALPSLGIKVDAIPGRLNQAFLIISEPGSYFGQCSELCGTYHAHMPIVIKAVDSF